MKEKTNLSLPFHPELLFLSVEGAQTAAYQLQNMTFSNLIQTTLYQCPFNAYYSETRVVTDLNIMYTTLNLPTKYDHDFNISAIV